jgi:large subunit ribosomal protein L24
MKCKIKIRKGDPVIVIAGDEKGKIGPVLKVFPKHNTLLIKGVNLVKRHQKRNKAEGEIIIKEAPIQISNVAFFDKKNNTRTKLGFKFLKSENSTEKDIKVRVAKKTNETLPDVA